MSDLVKALRNYHKREILDWDLLLEAADEIERLLKFKDVLAGLPDGAIDGGWTARGLNDYTIKLEHALKLAIRQNECDMLLTGDELRKCRAVLLP